MIKEDLGGSFGDKTPEARWPATADRDARATDHMHVR